jgi:hypothetical protein
VGRSASLSRAVPGYPDATNRHPEDYYRTPRRAVDALLAVERFDGPVWEPACGDGAISEILLETGHQVVSTDLIDRGYGQHGVNFLQSAVRNDVKHVITNPPFRLAQAFVEHALELVDGKVVMLMRTLFLEGGRRKEFFARTPLARVWVFSSRINVARGGDPRYADGLGGMVSFSWFVWEHGHVGSATLGPWSRATTSSRC